MTWHLQGYDRTDGRLSIVECDEPEPHEPPNLTEEEADIWWDQVWAVWWAAARKVAEEIDADDARLIVQLYTAHQEQQG